MADLYALAALLEEEAVMWAMVAEVAAGNPRRMALAREQSAFAADRYSQAAALRTAAQAIEARRAATAKAGAVEDESAVGNADAPKDPTP